MIEVICVLVGVVIGIVLSHLRRRKSADPPIGDLVLDKTYPQIVPYLALEPTTDLSKIPNRKRVTLVTQAITNSRK